MRAEQLVREGLKQHGAQTNLGEMHKESLGDFQELSNRFNVAFSRVHESGGEVAYSINWSLLALGARFLYIL